MSFKIILTYFKTHENLFFFSYNNNKNNYRNHATLYLVRMMSLNFFHSALLCCTSKYFFWNALFFRMLLSWFMGFMLNDDTLRIPNITKKVKIRILKSNIFCLKEHDFLTKNVIFQNFDFCIIPCSLVNFGPNWPNLPFWNSQSTLFEHT